SSTTTLGFAWPTSTSALPNASRVASPCFNSNFVLAGFMKGPFLCQLGQSPLFFVDCGSCSMELRIVLHERNSLAFDGVRDQYGGPSLRRRGLGKGPLQRGDIVSVHFNRMPAEAAPLVRNRLVGHDVLHKAIQLDAVIIDDRHHIIHFMKPAK